VQTPSSISGQRNAILDKGDRMLKRIALTAMVVSVGVAAPRAVRPQQHSTSSTHLFTLTPLDYLQIQQLVARYAYALDSGADSGRMYADLFSPEGAFVERNGQEITGRDALAALAVRTQKGPMVVFHFIMNHVIEPTADGAIGREYLIQLKIGEDGKASEVAGGGHYDDAYVKTANGWRFKRRQFIRSTSGPQSTHLTATFDVPARVGESAQKKASSLAPADYVEIQQLIARYPYALDTGTDHGGMFAGLFTPDGKFTAGKIRLAGREQLTRFAWEHRPGQGPLYARNFSTNVSIAPSSEGARGRIFAVVFDIGENDKPSAILNGGHYEDVYVRTSEGWRIKAREYFASEDGPAPADLPRPPIGKDTVPVPLVRPVPAAKTITLTTQDYLDIQQLTARYSHALDTGADNGYAYADLFTPDGSAFDRWIGRERIAEIPRWNPHGPRYVRHFAMNHLIEPTADGALGKQYVVVIDIGTDGKASSIFLGGQYQDVYVKTANGWRFKSRTEFRSGFNPSSAARASR
jgi:hypothetical protein